MSSNELFTFLQDKIREKYRNDRFGFSINSKVSCMNAYIENRHGHLCSRVHDDPTIQRCTLPYVTGHSKSAHSD